MRFTKEIEKFGSIKWKRKFAFLPIEIEQDYVKGIKTIVWFECYEEKYKYCGPFVGWVKENQYRLMEH